MKTIEQRLADHPFLKGVPTEQIKLLAEDTVPMIFQPGEMLFIKGRKAQYLFLVEEGLVAVGLLKGKKNRTMTVSTVKKGGNLGWSWAFAPYRWKFDARAKTRVQVLALEGRPTMNKLDRYPLLGYAVMKNLALSLSKGLEATRESLVKVLHQYPETEFVYLQQPMF